MSRTTERITHFFDLYAKRFNDALESDSADIAGTVGSFTSCFIAANPDGVSCGMNNDQFAKAIGEGYAFYRNIGIKSMNISSLEITMINEFYAMTRIRWRSGFVRKELSKGDVEFENIYFLRVAGNDCLIFGYITGDEQKVLKELGLI